MNQRIIRAPRGTELSAKSWQTEAALRMLMNNLDPEVAERPGDLVVYGGIGRAARDWESFDRIVADAAPAGGDETLLVQSGKPVGVFRTHADAPRVLIANSNLVPHWATWEHFHELDRRGLMMYGQMTAGSWIYIGSQGIVQGTYETFVEVGRQHYGGSLAGRWILTAGLGGMGGAQPLAATMAGASCLAVECQPSRIEMRLRTGYLDRQAATLDEALAIVSALRRRRSRSGCSATPPTCFPNWCAAASGPIWSPTRPPRTTRSTATCRRAGRVAEWEAGASATRPASTRPPSARWPAMCARCSTSTGGRAHARLRQQHPPDGARRGRGRRLRLPRLRPRLYPPAVLPRDRAVPLGGAVRRPRGHLPHRRQGEGAAARQRPLHRWLDMARERIQFQGLPARICWVGLGDRHRLGLAFNEMVAAASSRRPW